MAHNLYAAKDDSEAQAYARRVVEGDESLKIADVPLRDAGDGAEIHKTTPAVALAIEEVRRAREQSLGSVVMSIENVTHVQALENYEREMCQAFLAYKAYHNKMGAKDGEKNEDHLAAAHSSSASPAAKVTGLSVSEAKSYLQTLRSSDEPEAAQVLNRGKK